MLGVIDSGLGGLSVYQRIRQRLPQEEIIYLADQANSPLGVRPSGELAGFFQRYVDRLQDFGVDAIAMGSNTLCAISREHGWPSSGVPIIDMIQPTARAVVGLGKKRIGVIATLATARSGVYGAAIRELSPHAEIREVAASELVGFVEAGLIRDDKVMGSLKTAKSKFSDPIEVLVLGCTHFTWLDRAIAEVFGSGVELLDPADVVASEVAASLPASHEGVPEKRGATRFMTTGDAQLFARNIVSLIGPLRDKDTVIKAAGISLD